MLHAFKQYSRNLADENHGGLHLNNYLSIVIVVTIRPRIVIPRNRKSKARREKTHING